MSSSAGESSTTNAFPTGWIGNPSPGGASTQSTLYLLTFLITLVVLGIISAALLLRAYYVRRRFQRRIQEAIANGQALPPDALAGLGLNRPRRGKPEKKVGPMPTMWEAEMYKDDVDAEGSKRTMRGSGDGHGYQSVMAEKPLGDGEWANLTPLGMVHFPEGEVKPEPAQLDLPYPIYPPTMPRRQVLRSLFRRDDSDPLAYLQGYDLNRVKTGHTVVARETSYEVPIEGTEVVLGVMIAMPTDPSSATDRWTTTGDDDEDEDYGEGRQVPDVCLGVMGATIGSHGPLR